MKSWEIVNKKNQEEIASYLVDVCTEGNLDFLIECIEYLEDRQELSLFQSRAEELGVVAAREGHLNVLKTLYGNLKSVIIMHTDKILKAAADVGSVECVEYLLKKAAIHKIHVNPYGAYTKEIKQMLEDYAFLEQRDYRAVGYDLHSEEIKLVEWLSHHPVSQKLKTVEAIVTMGVDDLDKTKALLRDVIDELNMVARATDTTRKTLADIGVIKSSVASLIEDINTLQMYDAKSQARSEEQEAVASVAKFPAAGILSPSKAEQYSLSSLSRKLSKELFDCDLDKKAAVLEHTLASMSNWRYPIYNELAAIQFKQEKYKECLDTIKEAVVLIEKGNTTTNVIKKAVVYYNFSQFLMAVPHRYLDDIKPFKIMEDALRYVDKALQMFRGDGQSDNVQKFLVQKAFICEKLQKTDIACECYSEALSISVEAFLERFTTGGTGKELVWFAISRKATDILDKLLALSAKFDVNFCDEGKSMLLLAVETRDISIVAKVLNLGADIKFNNSDALSYAKEEDGCQEILQLLQSKIISDARVDTDPTGYNSEHSEDDLSAEETINTAQGQEIHLSGDDDSTVDF